LAEISNELISIRSDELGDNVRSAIAQAIDKINIQGCSGGPAAKALLYGYGQDLFGGEADGFSDGGNNTPATLGQVAQLEKYIDELEYQVNKISEAMSTYKSALENQETHVHNLESRCNGLADTVNSMQASINDIKTSSVSTAADTSGLGD
jgi:uncharacterized phage infection (PIP) family protein YhgE